MAHSQEEHLEAEQLLERLQATDPASAGFDRLLAELVDAVSHHVEEEEFGTAGNTHRLGRRSQAGTRRRFPPGRAEHLGDLPGEATKDELLQMAENVELTGASSMSKQELDQKLKEQAQQ